MTSSLLTLRFSTAAIALALSSLVNAAPITYSLNHTFSSFSFGLYSGSDWTLSGTITTNGNVANPGDTAGSAPGRLLAYNGTLDDFVSYNITVANAVEGISYVFATNTTENLAIDNNAFGNTHSVPTDLWADANGSLFLKFLGLVNNTTSVAGAFLNWEGSRIYLYDYAAPGNGAYIFYSTDYTFSGYDQELTAGAGASIPVSNSLSLGLLGLVPLVTLRRRNKSSIIGQASN